MMYTSQLKKKKNKQNCFWTKVMINLMLSVNMTYICHEVKSLQT